jgi:uncharacterized SAM-binding protein YcdF (DUF218 family)
MNNRAIQDITDFIFMEDIPQPSDIILIPGTSQSVICEKAAELYHAGYAPRILPSGRFSSNNGRFASKNIDNPRYAGEYATDFAYCKHILMENGVPESAIIQEDQATNSMENAMFSAQVLRQLGLVIHKAILCCQAFHARRAFLSYACYFPGTELLVAPTATHGITKENWFNSEKGYQKVMGEIRKCGTYFQDMYSKKQTRHI